MAAVGTGRKALGKGRELRPRANIPLSIDTTVNPNALSGGFNFFQDQKFTREVYKADLSTFFGPHSIKAGIDYEHVKAVNNNFNGGAGQRIYKLSRRGWHGHIYYRHRFYVNDRALRLT